VADVSAGTDIRIVAAVSLNDKSSIRVSCSAVLGSWHPLHCQIAFPISGAAGHTAPFPVALDLSECRSIHGWSGPEFHRSYYGKLGDSADERKLINVRVILLRACDTRLSALDQALNRVAINVN
jgi:hypothetical protein